MTLKELRKEKGLTQASCAEYLGVSIRTYKRYESDEKSMSQIKHEYVFDKLRKYGYIDEEHGILTIEQIRKKCGEVFKSYEVDFCYLFGSYAKGKETENSDVDLLVSIPIDGLKYFELVEELRETLCKKVDLLDITQLVKNEALAREVMKYGIKIYG